MKLFFAFIVVGIYIFTMTNREQKKTVRYIKSIAIGQGCL